MLTSVRETERKFDAAEHDPLPVLSGTAGVARPVLREIGMQAHRDGENGYTFGLLHGQQNTVIHNTEGALPAAWRRLAAGKWRRWLTTV